MKNLLIMPTVIDRSTLHKGWLFVDFLELAFPFSFNHQIRGFHYARRGMRSSGKTYFGDFGCLAKIFMPRVRHQP